MKNVLILRHSKAEHGTQHPDHERTLTGSGRRDARDVGTRMAELALLPDSIIASDSVRTRQTVEELCRSWPATPETFAVPELFTCDADQVAGIVRLSAPAAAMVLVVGHNPAMEQFVSGAAGSPVSLKTSDLAILEVVSEEGWKSGEIRALRLDRVVRPGRRGHK